MFSGIVQACGLVTVVQHMQAGMRWNVHLGELVAQGRVLQPGDSIALDGACHTVEQILDDHCGQFFSSTETLAKTNLNDVTIGWNVNLEVPLTLGTPLGGHLVSGHIDGLAELVHVQSVGEGYELRLSVPQEFYKYVIYKGSVCLNGISLTVASFSDGILIVAVIPHTWKHTNLQYLSPGAKLNFEADLVAKYLESLSRSYLNQTRT